MCREATELMVNWDCQPLTGVTNRFMIDSQENTCGGNVDDDAWFKFTAISPFTRVTLSTDQVNDMALVLFEKNCITEIACGNEKGIGGQEILNIETNEGEIYFVQLYEVNEGWGPFLICISAFEEDPDKKKYCELDLTFETTITASSCLDSISGSIQLATITGGVPPYVFQLGEFPFQSDSLFSNLNSGVFNISIIDSDSCRKDTIFDIPTIQTGELNFSLGNDLSIGQGEEIRLSPITNISAFQTRDIQWSIQPINDCPAPCFKPTFLADISTPISASLMTIGNCEVNAQLLLTVTPKLEVYMPNAFSPNTDGINDRFLVHAGAGIKQVNTFQIFDRWGSLVFEQTNFSPNVQAFGWDGSYHNQPMPAGLFVYFIEFDLPDGRNQFFTGEVLLIR